MNIRPEPASSPPLGVFRRGDPGAVLQLKLDNGQFGYIQYICPGWFAPAIRVLPGTYDEPLGERELRRLVAGPSLFRTQYGIDREWRKSGARVVANLPVPETEVGMPPFRMAAYPADDGGCWVKRTDGSTVSNPQYAADNPGVDFDDLPLWGIPFFGTLSWQMETQWTPRLARGSKLNLPPQPNQSDPAPERVVPAKKRRIHTTYFAVFSAEPDVIAAHEALRDEAGFVAPFGYDEDNEEWFLQLERPGRPDDDVERQLTEIASQHGGHFSGNIVGPFA